MNEENSGIASAAVQTPDLGSKGPIVAELSNVTPETPANIPAVEAFQPDVVAADSVPQLDVAAPKAEAEQAIEEVSNMTEPVVTPEASTNATPLPNVNSAEAAAANPQAKISQDLAETTGLDSTLVNEYLKEKGIAATDIKDTDITIVQDMEDWAKNRNATPPAEGQPEPADEPADTEVNSPATPPAEQTPTGPKTETPKSTITRQTELNNQIADLEANETRTLEQNAELAKLQENKADLDEFASLEHRKNNPANQGEFTTDQQKRYNELNKKLNPEQFAAENDPAKLKAQSEELIKNIQENKGEFIDNFLKLEDVARKMRGEAGITGPLRKRLGEALKGYVNGEKLNNKEAEEVMDRIAELFGLELQLSRIPEQYADLEKQADEADQQIDVGMDKLNKTIKKEEKSKVRQEVYASYNKLLMAEAQMSQLLVLDKEIYARFEETRNYLNFHLGRQNIFSYAINGVGNKSRRALMSSVQPSLRSTRHRGVFGIGKLGM